MATTTQVEIEEEGTSNPQQTTGTFNLRQTFQDVPDQQQAHSEDTPDEDAPQNILRRAVDVPYRDYISPLPGRSLTTHERRILELKTRLESAHKTNSQIWAHFNQPNPNPLTYTRIPLQDKGKSPTEIPMDLQDRAEIPETPVRLDLVVLVDLADPEDLAEI